MVGVLAGALLSIVLLRILKYPFTISMTGLLISFLASFAVGILAGIYPSKKATLIEPVDIIRS
jgi:ABC-type antimicrobial peptide transport system permease subunit